MKLRSRRIRRSVAVLAAMLLFGLLTVFVAAAPASALTSCAPGSAVISALFCEDLTTGDVSQRLDLPTGSDLPESTSTGLYESDLPSSVMAAGEGAGTTAAEGEGLALADGVGSEAVAGGGALITDAALLNPVTAIPMAGLSGYVIGVGIDHIACHFGLDALCTNSPSPGSSWKPNTDVTPVTSGAFNPASATVQAYGKLTFNLLTPPGAPTYGQKTPWRFQGFGATYTAYSGAGDGAYTLEYQCIGGTLNTTSLGGSSWNYLSGNQLNLDNSNSPAASCPSTGLDFVEVQAGSAVVTTGSTPKGFTVKYCPPGSSCAPAQVPANPQRYWKTVPNCTDSNGNPLGGGTPAISSMFYETAPPFPAYPSVTASNCPAGSSFTGWTVYESTVGGSPADKVQKTVTIPQTVANFPAAYPQCVSGGCRLGLWKIDGTDYDNCYSGGTDCSGWFKDPNKTSDYQCTYGVGGDSTYSAAEDVALSECNVLSPTFDPSKQATGASPVGDPKTGQSVPVTAPSGTGSGDPDDGTIPGANGASCFPGGFVATIEAGPVQWVERPVKCAIAWAFIPDGSVVSDEWNDTWNTIKTRPPVDLVEAVFPVVSGFTSSVLNGCSGHLADFGDGLVVPCSPPGNPAWFTAMYAIGEVLIAGLTAFGLWSIVEKGFDSK